VIAGRWPAKIRLAKLRAQRLALDVKETELRFSRDEIYHLFHHAIVPTELAEIERLTGGWPVAVQFALNGWERSGKKSASFLLEQSLGEAMGDYLAEELFDPLPASFLNHLVRIAILDVVDVSAVRHLLSQDESWYQLIDHPTLRAFLLSAGEGRESFRFQPVLRQALRW
jgi:ATP/maltotriose-dependent transcriptional regulator MalT